MNPTVKWLLMFIVFFFVGVLSPTIAVITLIIWLLVVFNNRASKYRIGVDVASGTDYTRWGAHVVCVCGKSAAQYVADARTKPASEPVYQALADGGWKKVAHRWLCPQCVELFEAKYGNRDFKFSHKIDSVDFKEIEGRHV